MTDGMNQGEEEEEEVLYGEMISEKTYTTKDEEDEEDREKMEAKLTL